MRKRALIAGLVGALMLVPTFAGATSASSQHRQVQVLDDCRRAPCSTPPCRTPMRASKNGGTTFEAFIGQLVSMGQAPAWRFAPSRMSLSAGGSIDAYSRGGEFHTFTEVAAFGGGCVQILNEILGLSPVPECANAGVLFAMTGIAPGGELEGAPLAPGTHRFECLIHPWMRATVTVGG